MAKKIWNNPIDKHVEWAGDENTEGAPVSGEMVQKFIKDSLEKKAGEFYPDVANNRYLVFADTETRDAYIKDSTRTDLILGAFDAPSNYTATIDLVSDTYNAIPLNSTGNYIEFSYDIKNKQGVSTGESAIITYTIIRNATQRVISETKRPGELVRFNVDKYIAEGINTIIVGVTGRDTLTATTVSITYQVVNLTLTDDMDISKVYDLRNGPQTIEIPFKVSGYGKKTVEWYIDGVHHSDDEVVDTVGERTKRITISNFQQGKHSLQIRAYTLVNGERFETDILYRDILVYTGVDNNVIIGVAINIPKEYGILERNDNVTIYDMVQYVPYTLRFATYSPTNTAVTDVLIYLGDVLVSTVGSTNNRENTIVLTASKDGMTTLSLKANDRTYEIPVDVRKTNTTLQEITDDLVLDFNTNGKNNDFVGKEEWRYNDIVGTLTGFNWTNSSGWVGEFLEISKGATFAINYAPLANNPTNTGKTIEIEWKSKNVTDDNAVICDLRNEAGVGILITATKVAMISADGVVIETEYKSEENVRVAFVINRANGVTNQRLSFIYAGGIISRGVNWAVNDSYTSDALLSFCGTEGAEVSLKYIRIYDSALSSDQILNNFTLYRSSISEMMEVYDRNNVYIEGSTSFSPEKMSGRLPVMIVTGDIPTLENTSDKDTQIIVDIEYINMQNPSKSFKMEGAAMRPQGTSSMGYPKKNFRIYTQEVESTVLYDANGYVVEDKLYSFTDNAQPVDCWCLKADYAESSGTHNTGIARLWNKALVDARVTYSFGKNDPRNIDNEPVLRTQAQKKAIEEGYPYDVRTTIDGFPILLFYRPSKNDDIIFIGKYNFNNDKSTESVFGFKGIPNFNNSRMQCWEVLNNGNALALFTTTEGFDDNWSEAFESRYPNTKSPNTEDLKAFCEWMVSVSQEDFTTQKWEHLNVYMMAAYWCYLMRHAAADQFVKNAMFTSEDGQHFYYILYDNDTINGLINTGYLRIKPTDGRQTIDDSGAYVFAGHDSRLWNMLEADEEFKNIVSAVDNALYSAGISYLNTIKIFDEEQADKWVERVYNQDAQYKYIGPYNERGINNLYMLQGKRDLHRKWWLAKRFSIYDAKYVSGTYKSQSVEIKCLNGTEKGQQFTIVAGYPLDYGYGINNVPREFGIPLNVGDSHTFTTKEDVFIGDPIRIYGAPNIAELDLSKMTPRLSNITIDYVYDEALGTKLSKLIIGNAENYNYEVSEISGLRQAEALEYLDIQGITKMTSLDLSNHKYFKTLKAKGSGISSVSFAKGAPVERLELPASMRSLSLEQLPYLKGENIILEDITGLSIINIKSCPNVTNDFNFVYNWYVNKTTVDSRCSLVMDNVNWHLADADRFMEVLNLYTNGGIFSIKGKIKMDTIKIEQIYAIRDILGESSFDPNAELYVDIPSVLQINAEDSVLEGNNLQFTASLYPYLNGTYTWSLESVRVGCSIDQNGLLTTEETALDTSNVVVKVRFMSTDGEVLTATKTVSVVRRTYPQNIVINGASDPRESAEYTWSHNTEGVNGNYSVVWSLEGSMTSYWRIASSDSQRCVLEKTGPMPSSVSGTIKVTIVREFDKGVASVGSLALSLPVVFPGNATIIGDVNPLEKPYTYTWETTTEGVNGEFYAEWVLSGDVTSVVEIASYDNESCTMRMLDAVTELVDGLLTLNIRKSYDNTLLASTTKELQAMLEGVIITSKTNPEVQKVLYEAGLVANESYSLLEEVQAITSGQLVGDNWINSFFYDSYIKHFEEFQYFTGLDTLPDDLFHYVGTLESIVLPPNITKIGKSAFHSCDSLIQITIPNGVTEIGEYAFYGCASLKSISVPHSVISFSGNIFSGCTGELYIDCDIPDQGQSNSLNAFMNSKFTKIVVGDNVETIGRNAFYRVKVETIVLGKNVKLIKPNAFNGCSWTKYLYCFAHSTPDVTKEVFGEADYSWIGYNVKSSGQNMLYVPANSIGYESGYWLDPLQNSSKCGFILSKTL